MRTSRISRDTNKILDVLSTSPRRTRRSQGLSLQSFAHTTRRRSSPTAKKETEIKSEVESENDDSSSELSSPISSIAGKEEEEDEDRKPSSKPTTSQKRKRETDSATPPKKASPLPTSKKLRRAPSKPSKTTNPNATPSSPPPHWEEVYTLISTQRTHTPAPVDTLGCERLALPTSPPQDQHFQHLVSLMLSPQTKDTATATAMRNLHTSLPGGLTIPSILSTPEATLDTLIRAVGFHATKAKNILLTAALLKAHHASTVPKALEPLLALPGVGPKIAHLTLQAAHGIVLGIGVDTHVHRITNRLGWHRPETKTPEETRRRLEAWLPQAKWREINALLVGFGQVVCLPVGRRCGACDVGRAGLCPSAVVEREVKEKKGRGKVRVKGEPEVDVRVEVEEEVTATVGGAVERAVEVKAEEAEEEGSRKGEAETAAPPPLSSGVPDIEDLLSPGSSERSSRARARTQACWKSQRSRGSPKTES
ncbi:DNA glycosylase [Patellaria atrata CBS 101060]|uniref:Endonuclease III homolog n=1 Tax=Patellaria atrata CBS 101060 TaxID=1346257 RepID=A0A9P4SAW4_9PEZI|nr:DNA glycosylase [Patellaria atrata CBS 101060]